PRREERLVCPVDCRVPLLHRDCERTRIPEVVGLMQLLRVGLPRLLSRALFTSASVVVMAGCGGGENAATSSPRPVPGPTPPPAPAPTPSPPVGPASIRGLHVVGNQIQNDSAQPVVLHGVNKSGTEYACIQNFGIFDPPGSDSDDTLASIKSWSGINAV